MSLTLFLLDSRLLQDPFEDRLLPLGRLLRWDGRSGRNCSDAGSSVCAAEAVVGKDVEGLKEGDGKGGGGTTRSTRVDLEVRTHLDEAIYLYSSSQHNYDTHDQLLNLSFNQTTKRKNSPFTCKTFTSSLGETRSTPLSLSFLPFSFRLSRLPTTTPPNPIPTSHLLTQIGKV